MWGIARRQAALWLRRRGPALAGLAAEDAERLLAAGPGGLTGPERITDPAETAMSRAELAAAIGTLGPAGGADRETWRLLYVEDRSVAEIAQLMSVPVGTVKSRAHRVRRLMRAALRGNQPAREGGTR